MRCGASRPGWRRRPRHCGADKVCCAPIGPLRRASATVSWRVDGSGRDACACTRGGRRREHGIDGATEAATFHGRVWPRCPFHRGLCRGRAEAPAGCGGPFRRARIRPPNPSSKICCDGTTQGRESQQASGRSRRLLRAAHPRNPYPGIATRRKTDSAAPGPHRLRLRTPLRTRRWRLYDARVEFGGQDMADQCLASRKRR